MRLIGIATAWLGLIACGGKGTTPTKRPPDACTANDAVGCFEQRRKQCRAGKAWRLEIAQLGTVEVAASGALRMHHADKNMFGTDSQRWLACLQCPGGRRCIPYLFRLSLSLEIDQARCSETMRNAPPWHGRPSRLVEYRCRPAKGKPTAISIRVVPSLSDVRDALIRAGAIERGGQLAAIDGLVVSVLVGARPALSITELALSSCTRFSYPAGHPRVAAPDRFAELPALMPKLRHELERAGSSVVDVMMAEAVRRAVLVVGRVCPGGPPPYQHKAIQDCIAKQPQLRQTFSAAVNEAMAEQLPGRKRTLERLRRSHIDLPLCEHFGGKVRAR